MHGLATLLLIHPAVTAVICVKSKKISSNYYQSSVANPSISLMHH